MRIKLCPDDVGPFDFRNDCVRNSWSALLPAGFVLALLIGRQIPIPERVRAVFQTYLTLQEAEALEARAAEGENVMGDEDAALGGGKNMAAEQVTVPLWRTLVLSWVSMAQTLVWLGIGSFRFIDYHFATWSGLRAILVAFSWFYAATRPMARPTATPPMDLFSLFVLHLIGGVITLGGVLFDNNVYGVPLPSAVILAAYIINLVTVVGLLAVILAMPLDIPSSYVKKEDIGVTVSLEDYTSLFGWLTFSWVYPMLKKGRYITLDEKDVWRLSPTIQARPVYIKFSKIKGASLLWRLWKANSLDLSMDVVITFFSVVFNYASPFFLKRILDAIDNPTPENKSRAYIYAFLAFLSSLMKSQADLQHLWIGRRAATRIRSELMAAIYDKALKRKDFSGIVDKDKQKDAPAAGAPADPKAKKKFSKDKAKEDKAKAATADDPKAGADIGKIVNLMAGDANRVSMTVSAMYFIYGAPFEIIIASVFLYQLLGWSAFAGFLVLAIGWPLNSVISRRSIRIQKGLLAARDKRMSVLSELIGAVKFIKFFAWEEKWTQRAMDARENEMGWMIKVRINSIMFSLLWNSAPILVSVVSFFVYVMQGNKLTVSIAFTSIALFNMVRMPLNVIPTWIVQILQTGVALNRINTYLEEDEVSEQVSTLKKDRSSPAGVDEEEGLGIENASFKWNEIEEKDDKADAKGKSASQTTLAGEENLVPDSASAAESEHKFELRDINVRFPEGELTIVTGPTASGKTALLMALLGELTLLPGGRIIMSKNPSKVDEHGLAHTISYAAQTPWLRHQSIKDNILFGSPYDEERYNAVIEACALTPDLEQLEDGDSTEIGARGVSLSGGQKARVALARATYAHTKYVLLDDPLSAVDSHTSRFLFENLLCGPLLANRTVILVTHHVELVLPGAYYLVRMLDGRIDTQGTIKELRAAGALESITQDSNTEAISKEVDAAEQSKVAVEQAADKIQADAKKPRKLIKDEHREEGGVKWSIYKTYLKASSYWTWGLLFGLILINQFLGVTEKLWIKTWGEAYGQNQTSTLYAMKSFVMPEHELPLDATHFMQTSHSVAHTAVHKGFLGIDWPDANEHPLFYIGIYAGIGAATSLGSILSMIVQYTGALRASRLLFKQLLQTVVRATMRWHDTTPQGRMLNRFGKDVETIDSSLAGSLQAVNSSLASFFAAILTVGVVFPTFLIPATIIGLVYRELAIGYLNTGRDLRRMESNTRSPIFQGFSELLEGIVTVRAFSAEQRFLDNLYQKVDLTTQMWYMFWMTNRWLYLNFDALGATAVLVTTLFALSGVVNAGTAGLCITSAMAFTSSIYWACRFWTALELDLNSVERIVEYLELPQEPPAIIESKRPPAYWPSSSNEDSLIVVEDLVIKYAPELPSVLQGVSFALKGRERVGLLGRTGSGKSTLAMSILRFVDPASGRIVIDGIDISEIGIHDLRSRLTFIPQDATLFSGTLRDNLDPFNEHEDSECLDVLRRVQMITNGTGTSKSASRSASRAPSIRESSEATAVSPSTEPSTQQAETSSISSAALTDTDSKVVITLDTQVSAGGTNFSQGQRQLIAMARALLRRSNIIVLDEATSSIDFATDAKIQKTIREEFNNSLLLTVAHRLRTVIDYDRLIVLDKGQIVEFDTPLNLIKKEDGVFRNMCLKSGTFSELEAAAEAASQGKM